MALVILYGEKEHQRAEYAIKLRRRMKIHKLLIVFSFVSCSTRIGNINDNPHFVEPQNERSVVCERIDVGPAFIGGFLMRTIDDSSAVVRYFGADHLLARVSFSNGAVTPIMFVGRGPGEMMDANFASGGYISDDGSILIDLYDTNGSVMKTLDVCKSELSGFGVVTNERKIPGNSWVVLANRDKLCCKVILDDAGYSYQIFNDGGQLEKKFQIWELADVTELNNYMSSADCMKPDGSKIALCYCNLDKISIISLDRDKHNCIVTDKEWLKKDDLAEMRKQSSTGEGQNYYLYSCCDNEKIYALRFPGNEIRVFDWGGNYLERLSLDKNLICISVSANGNIYGTTMEDEFYQIVI